MLGDTGIRQFETDHVFPVQPKLGSAHAPVHGIEFTEAVTIGVSSLSISYCDNKNWHSAKSLNGYQAAGPKRFVIRMGSDHDSSSFGRVPSRLASERGKPRRPLR